MFITSRLARHVCVLLGYLYPALASAKAAVQQDPAAFTQWMTYWVVMSVFALAEGFVDFFVSWVPFYFEAKIVLIVWLALPRYQGASQIYQRFLHPYLEQYEGDIDTGLEEMRIEATKRIQSLGASAAAEIAKAVKRQGYSAKDQLFTRMLGMAAAVGASADVIDDSSVGRSSPSHGTIPEHEAGRGQRPGRSDERGNERGKRRRKKKSLLQMPQCCSISWRSWKEACSSRHDQGRTLTSDGFLGRSVWSRAIAFVCFIVKGWTSSRTLKKGRRSVSRYWLWRRRRQTGR